MESTAHGRRFTAVYRPLGSNCLPTTHAMTAKSLDAAELAFERDLPGCDLLWLNEGGSAEEALADYYQAFCANP